MELTAQMAEAASKANKADLAATHCVSVFYVSDTNSDVMFLLL